MPSILNGYCTKSDKPREDAEEEAKEFLQIIEDSAAYQFGKNHSIAYCLLGYLCAYYRHYYPLEFITSYLNNAANDNDIKVGSEYASKIGIKVTMPKWGASKSDYFYDKTNRVIAKGLSSVKYMGGSVAEELYALSSKKYDHFVDVLKDINDKTSLDSRQTEILIKIDFFSMFGNQRELLNIYDTFRTRFKNGEVKSINKELIAGSPMEEFIKKYSNGMTKAGKPAKSYRIEDAMQILRDIEDKVLSVKMDDLDDKVKIENFNDVMGYYGYCSGKEEDRPKLYVVSTYPLLRKRDGVQFGYSVVTRSIGSGKESRFTVFNSNFDADPIKEGDIIMCKRYTREGQYFTLRSYEHVM